MGKIFLENISLFGFHGCMKEEAKVGTFFRVDLEVDTDLSKAAMTDELLDVVNYIHLNRIVKEEMAIRSKLLEHVAQRIIRRIRKELPVVHRVKIKVCKLFPPLDGDVGKVCVIMKDGEG
ncbi:MAG: dihydroneopterin aldolase [Flavobacteriales bacterium AspAUS03]